MNSQSARLSGLDQKVFSLLECIDINIQSFVRKQLGDLNVSDLQILCRYFKCDISKLEHYVLSYKKAE